MKKFENLFFLGWRGKSDIVCMFSINTYICVYTFIYCRKNTALPCRSSKKAKDKVWFHSYEHKWKNISTSMPSSALVWNWKEKISDLRESSLLIWLQRPISWLSHFTSNLLVMAFKHSHPQDILFLKSNKNHLLLTNQ